MKKLIISVLVLVIIAVLALPKFIGSKGAQMHDNFFQQSAKQLMPGVVVESENMKDGWFNSEGTHRIKLSEAAFKNVFPGVKNVELDKEMDILVNTKFHHGPIAFSSLSGEGAAFSPVLAVGESTLQIDNNGKIIDLPGKLYTQVNATGSGGKAKYLIEEYTFQEENGSSINLDDVEIDFDISDKGEVVDGQGRSGKLSIHGNDGEKIVLSNMTFDADLEDKDGVWFGDSTVNFADFSFEDARGMSFGMKNLNLQGGNHGDAKSMKSAAQFTIGEFNVADMTFEDFTFDYSIDNLDTQAVSALQAVSKQGPQVDPTAALEHLKKIVEMSPSININELSVQTPQGKVQADLHVNLPDNVNMVFFPLSLLPQVQADSNIRIPKDVIPMLDALRPGTAQQTEMLVQGGLIKLDGNDYVSVIKMDKGEITVNGVVMPLPF